MRSGNLGVDGFIEETTSVETVRALVAYLARSLAGDPEMVRVELAQTEEDVKIHISVAADDLNFVIGRNGETARSFAVIANGVGRKLGYRIGLTIGTYASDMRKGEELP